MGKRGPKARPTKLRVLLGNPDKRPLPVDEPELPPEDLPVPPSWLIGKALDEWNRVAPGLHRLGLLYGVDIASLAAYCEAYARMEEANAAIKKMAEADPTYSGLLITNSAGTLMRNPLILIAKEAAADVVRYSAEFGMTPSARTRVSVAGAKGAVKNPAPPKSKFGNLVGVSGGKAS